MIREIANGSEGLYQDRREHSETEKSEDVGKRLLVQVAVRIRRSRGEMTTA